MEATQWFINQIPEADRMKPNAANQFLEMTVAYLILRENWQSKSCLSLAGRSDSGNNGTNKDERGITSLIDSISSQSASENNPIT